MSHALVSTQWMSLLVSLAAGTAVIVLRLRASHKPTSAPKIIMPPVGMASGFLMFVVPAMRIPWTWGIAAFVAGAPCFSYPLIRTSRFEVNDGQVYLKRSNMFIVVIVALLILRLILHDVVEQYVSMTQSASIFFILAFGMLLPWRVAMLRQYRKLTGSADAGAEENRST
ncbi:CcdC family protein [Paenibacillus thiaminolyticus]|uniref:CcdC family protein n=1 Tax=Paenibacillus thiaminolyticus TaxID=49283 RepID=UPI00164E9548|nr:cytochrome c biogenesis protein CcdC [Paenibacillus thiaminolyticus]